MQAKYCKIKNAGRERGSQYWKVIKTWPGCVCCFRVYWNWLRDTHICTHMLFMLPCVHWEDPPPHHAFPHHESLYHNSGICQGADVLPAESRHQSPDRVEEAILSTNRRKNSSCFHWSRYSHTVWTHITTQIPAQIIISQKMFILAMA